MLLENSLYAGILIAAVLGLRPLLRRAPARLLVILWSAALLRLLLPVRLPSPLSIYNCLPRMQKGLFTSSSMDLSVTYNVAETAGPAAVVAAQEGIALMDWSAALLLLWTVGALICVGILLLLVRRTRRALCTALPLIKNDVVRQICPKVQVYSCECISTPLNCGVLRPRILLPSGMQDGDPRLLRHALAHEMAHIRGRHNLLKAAALLALCLHWFNPMVYLLLLFMGRDLERSCDEAVLRQLGKARRTDYARSLLRFAGAPGKLRPLCSAFGDNPVEERIKGIMGFGRCSKGRTALYATASMILCALLISSPVVAGGDTDAVSIEGSYKTQSGDYAEGAAGQEGSLVLERVEITSDAAQSTEEQGHGVTKYLIKLGNENPLLSALFPLVGVGAISVAEDTQNTIMTGQVSVEESTDAIESDAQQSAWDESTAESTMEAAVDAASE